MQGSSGASATTRRKSEGEQTGVSTGGIELNGMVLKTAPAGEYDRRIVLLTRERGKITAFARGARKPGSALLAATVPFAFGTFRVYEGKSAYTCVSAVISNYFEGLKTDYIGACYGAYFMEFADYYAQENLDGTDMLNLLYAALLMLERKEIPDRLVRYAFEVRLMVLGGEFPMDVTQDENLLKASRQAFYHMITAPVGRLFSFQISDEAMEEIAIRQDKIRGRFVDRSFRSLEVLDTLLQIQYNH